MRACLRMTRTVAQSRSTSPHAEDLRTPVDAMVKDDVGGVRVPTDVDRPVEYGVDETLVVGEQQVIGGDAGVGEVGAKALPDRHHARVIGDGLESQLAAPHGTGSPEIALPDHVRRTPLVGAMTAPARASRRWRSIGNAGV